MNLLSRIAFPVAVTALAAAGALDFGRAPFLKDTWAAAEIPDQVWDEGPVQDTVVYPVAGYKLRRTLSLDEIVVRDTTSGGEEPADTMAVAVDTVVRISPRDSFKAQLDTSL